MIDNSQELQRLLERQQDSEDTVKRKILSVIAVSILIFAIILTFTWYSWKLFVVITLYLYSNNLGESNK